jgi:hypothetical protein
MNRRNFLAATAATLGSKVLRADTSSLSEDWLEAVRNSQAPLFLDAGSFSRSFAHFDRATAYLDGENGREIRAVVIIGLHGAGLAHGLSAQIWEEWDLASQLEVAIPNGRQNENRLRVWVSEMARRYPGQVKVLACQRTLSRWALRHNPSEPFSDIVQANTVLIPSVNLVSAMVTAAARAQHLGAAYSVSND